MVNSQVHAALAVLVKCLVVKSFRQHIRMHLRRRDQVVTEAAQRAGAGLKPSSDAM